MRQRTLIAALATGSLLAPALQARAQQPAPAGWARVEALTPGTVIHVKTAGHNQTCAFVSATDDALTCGGKSPGTVPRADIRSIKQSHRARSVLVGLAIGAGGGAAVGAPLGKSGSFVGHGAAAAIFAVPLGLIGGIVGAATDFTHSTLYKAN